MKKLLAIVASLTLVPVQVAAQSETGTRIGGRPAQAPESGSNTERARIWLERYAACIAKRDPKHLAGVLDAPINQDVAVGKLVEGNYDSCLSAGATADELRMNARLMLGALYAERVTRMVGRLTPDMLPPDVLPLPSGADLDQPARARASLVRFGECVMRKNPPAALEFVAADAGKSRETAALKDLVPYLGQCVDAGVQFQLSRSILEASLAEAIYRTLQNSDPAKGSTLP